MAATRRFLTWTLFRRVFIALFILGLIGALVALAYVNHLARDLPDHKELANYNPPVTSRVHAGDGKLIAEFAREQRIFVPYDAISADVVNAFVSAEDKNFFEHSGIDWLGMLRGVSRTVMNKLQGKSGMQGGSTISQQVAKVMLLSSEQTVQRKIKEAILTRRMEKAFSKEKIMELYLNEIYLGRNSYGVGSAALNYFNKSLPELNLAEAATLAALAQRPGAVNPDTNPERLVVRRNWVLGRMVVNGYITQEAADAAIALPLTTQRRLKGPEFEAASYFVEEVRRELIDTYDENTLYTGGLSIRTTIDTRLQLAAQKALRDGIVTYDRRHEYRGPFARIAPGPQALAELAALSLPGGAGRWEAGMVSAVRETDVSVTLKDGASVAITPEDVEWARKTFRSVDGNDGITLGDVVLVEVTRETAPVAAPASTPSPGKIEEAPLDAGEVDTPEPASAEEAGDAPAAALGRPVGVALLRQIPQAEGALIAMDPHTGRVLAMAGGFSFWKSQFNRATQAKRQPGSTFKPFVYAAALQNGYTPASKVLDAPFVDYDVSTDKFWKPSNYEAGQFFGLTTMRIGLEKSRNAMTVRMAQDIGMEPIVTLAHEMGVYNEPPPPFLSIALGAAETTPLQMVEGYAAFVNGGKRVRATFLDRVQDRRGRTLYTYDERACEGCEAEDWDGGPPPALPDTRERVLDPVTAYQIVHMLEGVVQRGTGRRALKVGKPVAGKTGTSNDYVDAWFLGFSPDLVVGIWVGFDEPRTLGTGETGGSAAAPIFTDFMIEALADTPALPFRIPPGVRLVTIDARTGQLPGPGAAETLVEAFRPGTEPGFDFGEDRDLSIFGSGASAGAIGGTSTAEAGDDAETPLPGEEVIRQGLGDEW